MPQPRRATATEPPPPTSPPPARVAAAGAIGSAVGAGAGAAGAAGLVAPLLVAGSLGAKAVAGAVETVVAAFVRFQRRRRQPTADNLVAVLRAAHPEEDDDTLRGLVREEMAREQMFGDRMLERLRRDLPRAMAEKDADRRAERVKAIIERERRYMHAREQAMAERSLAAVERVALKRMSPLGAYWVMSPFVKQHTPDCVAMSGKFWPWEVLDEYHPPLHHGCPCFLLPLSEAVEQGLMFPDQVPDTTDAIRRAREIMVRYRGIREAAQPWEIERYYDWLIEEAEFEARLHPKDRRGRWRDTFSSPYLPSRPMGGESWVGGVDALANRPHADGWPHTGLRPMLMANPHVEHPRFQRYLDRNPGPPFVAPLNAAQRAGLHRQSDWFKLRTISMRDLKAGDRFSLDGSTVETVRGIGSMSGWTESGKPIRSLGERPRYVLRKDEAPAVYERPSSPSADTREPWQQTFDEFAADPRTLWHGTMWGEVGQSSENPLVHVGSWKAAHEVVAGRAGRDENGQVNREKLIEPPRYVWRNKRTGRIHAYGPGEIPVEDRERIENPDYAPSRTVRPAMVPVRIVGRMDPSTHYDFVGDRRSGQWAPEMAMRGILKRGQTLHKGYWYTNEGEGVEKSPEGDLIYTRSAVVPSESWLYTHEDFVRDAMRRGLEVPANVRAEYPDLATGPSAQPLRQSVAGLAPEQQATFERGAEQWGGESPAYADTAKALGLEGSINGRFGRWTEAENQEVFDTLGEIMERYPVLRNGPKPVTTVYRTSGNERRDRLLQSLVSRSTTLATVSWPTDGYQGVAINDDYKAAIGGDNKPSTGLTPASGTTLAGAMWHEAGHMLASAWARDNMQGRTQSRDEALALMKAYGITFDDVKWLSPYAASSPSEALGELSAMYHVIPRALDGRLREKAGRMFDDLAKPYEQATDERVWPFAEVAV